MTSSQDPSALPAVPNDGLRRKPPYRSGIAQFARSARARIPVRTQNCWEALARANQRAAALPYAAPRLRYETCSFLNSSSGSFALTLRPGAMPSWRLAGAPPAASSPSSSFRSTTVNVGGAAAHPGLDAMQREAIVGALNHHGADVQFGRRAQDAYRDLAAVGDEYFLMGCTGRKIKDVLLCWASLPLTGWQPAQAPPRTGRPQCHNRPRRRSAPPDPY